MTVQRDLVDPQINTMVRHRTGKLYLANGFKTANELRVELKKKVKGRRKKGLNNLCSSNQSSSLG